MVSGYESCSARAQPTSKKKYRVSPRTCRRKSTHERVGKKDCIYQNTGIVVKTAVLSSSYGSLFIRVELQVERQRQLFVALLLLTALSSSKRCSSRAARSLSSSCLSRHVFTTGAVAVAVRGDGFGFAFAFRSGPWGQKAPGGRERSV